MADIASRDQNRITTLMGVSSSDGTSPVTLYADPTTHRLLTSSAGGSGSVTSVSVVSANGFAGTVANPTTTPAITLTTTVTGILSGNGTAISAASTTGSGAVVLATSPTLTSPNLGTPTTLVATNATGTAAGLTAGTVTTNANLTGPITSTGNATAVASQTGTGSVFVMQASPTLTTAALGSSTATTQTPADNSTKVATTAYVDNAVLGQNFKEAAKFATTAALPASTYSNGSSGVGATLTEVGLGALSIDSNTPSVGDRVLIKNQASSLQNGIYTVTVVGSAGVAYVLTRATDADQTTEYKTGDSLFVTSGTANSATTWAYTGVDSPTMGTDAITYVQTAGQGSFSSGNGITITGNSIAIDTSVTVDKTTAQALTGKTYNGLTLTSTTGTFTLTNGKTLSVAKSLTLDGTDSTTMTFPTTSATIARTDSGQTFTGTQVMTTPTITTSLTTGSSSFDLLNTTATTVNFAGAATTMAIGASTAAITIGGNIISTNNAITASSNAATVPITHRMNTVTNSSAATLTITLTTTSAVDGQLLWVDILDFSAVAQTITWVNTEDSTVTAPTTSNGSTTLPLATGWRFNGATSKWRCVAKA